MEHTSEAVELLLLIAAIVAIAVQRIRIPYTVGLVITGMVLAFGGFAPDLQLTKSLIFETLLPPLIFEAALFIPWRELKKDITPLLLFATVGVLIASAIMTVGMHLLAGWEWASAGLFGAAIAATDPVAVIALFKEVNVGGRLRILVEAESLLNDGTAAVVFAVVLALTQGESLTAGGFIVKLFVTIVGGIVCGWAVGGIALLLAGHTEDHLIEMALTTCAAYGSFLLAEHFHLSGVLATLSAGLLLGNTGHLTEITDKGRAAILAFWEFAAFVANSLIFLLMGIALRQVTPQLNRAVLPILIALLLTQFSRAAAIYPISLLFIRTRYRIEWRDQHMLYLSGLRGAVALALTLGLSADIPRRAEIITVAFAVVAFSVVFQGTAIPPILRRLGWIETNPGDTAS